MKLNPILPYPYPESETLLVLETVSKLLVTVLPPPFVERQKGGDDLWFRLENLSAVKVLEDLGF